VGCNNCIRKGLVAREKIVLKTIAAELGEPNYARKRVLGEDVIAGGKKSGFSKKCPWRGSLNLVLGQRTHEGRKSYQTGGRALVEPTKEDVGRVNCFQNITERNSEGAAPIEKGQYLKRTGTGLATVEPGPIRPED